jgi:hypothetical protein
VTQGSWFDIIAFTVVGLVCAAVIARRLVTLFKSPAAGCGGGCSKCGAAGGSAPTGASEPSGYPVPKA